MIYLKNLIQFLQEEQIEHYKLEEGDGVLVEDDFNDERVIRESLISNVLFDHIRSFIRHDSVKFADAIDKIIKN